MLYGKAMRTMRLKKVKTSTFPIFLILNQKEWKLAYKF
jgi:hypothetical protein